ncbi:MAG TPA: hypothetical protein VG101_02105 [Puia sp.]|jgi:hypothetical protein|nr:hypothetical protein [Puia sp.]
MNVERILGLLAGIVISTGQVIYVINCLRKKITPSVLSWFGWACLMGTSLVSQIDHDGWQWSMTGIASSTVGCLMIAGVAWLSGNFSFRRGDLGFLIAGLGCVGVYVVFDNPWVTTVFAIIADALLGIPTIVKAYREPALERSAAWLLGVVSSTLALIICYHHDLIYMLFPAYLLLFNGVVAALVWGKRQVRVAAALVLVAGTGFVFEGCSKHMGGSGMVSGRSYRMGFANSAPRPDLSLILQSLNLWTAHADAAIVSTEVPWDSLISGEDPVKLVTDEYVQLAAVYRSKNLKLWLYIDPENGLNRASDSYPLVALGKSIAQPAMQQLYRRFVVVMDSMLRPDHLGLALETNLIRLAAPDSIYQGVKAAVNAAAGDVRAVDRSVPLSVSVQAEVAWGFPGQPSFVGVEQDFTDFPFLQELGISSYPYLAGYVAPSVIPLNYYSRIVAGHSVPLFVSEGGWSSAAAFGGPAVQAAYIDRQGQLLAQVKAIGWFQLTYTDIDLSGWGSVDSAGLAAFAFIGVVDTNFVAKPALSAWDSLMAVKLENI